MASLAFSNAFAELMLANSALEYVLLSDFDGSFDEAHADEMVNRIRNSHDQLVTGRAMVLLSIQTSEVNPDDFAEARGMIKPEMLAASWQDTMLRGDPSDVSAIAEEIKGDRLSTARRFVDELGEICDLYPPLLRAFMDSREIARDGGLKDALANNEVQIQAPYALLQTSLMEFMRAYLIDSLVATQVAFTTHGSPALVVAA